MTTPKADDLLESGDACHILHVGWRTLNRLAERGRLPVAARTPRGTRLFRRADVESLKRTREKEKARG